MLILDGKPVAQSVKNSVIKDVEEFKKKYKKSPQLAVVSVGDDPASKIYLKNKEKASGEVGIQFVRFELDKTQNQEELDALLTRLNTDADVNGILVQLPVPPQFKVDRILESMNPLKDSDGFHPENLGLLMTGKSRVAPCTPFGIMKMLEYYKVPVEGKKAVVIGRSNIVGRPMAQMLTNANATVTVCHSKTKDIRHFTKDADIVVVAAGQPTFFDSSYFGKQTVVIDVGIHRVNGKVVGDVNFEDCKGKVAGISPVPGGVGLMTVAMLLKNTVGLAFVQEAHRLL